jgi:alditol oxidase
MRSTTSELNWSGTYTYTAERIARPASLVEVPELVAGARHVHGLGTRHSFNDVADGPGLLLDLTAIPTDLVVDHGTTDSVTGTGTGSTVTMGAGTRYGVVAPDIDRAGLALHNMGSLPHISLAGAVATGTHGSGSTLGSLTTAVAALEIVTDDGTVRTLRRGDPDFDGAVMHLGLLGVVTRVTLDAEPTYRMRQDPYGAIPFDVFTERFAEVFAAGYSVCAYTDFGDQVRDLLVKSRIPDGAENVDVPDEIAGAPRRPGTPGDDHHTARDGSPGPWWDRLPHFPIGGVPSMGSEVQSEHFVPMRHGAAALDALRGLHDRIVPHLHVSELRTMAADDLWLSPTQGEDTLCIAFTWKKHPVEVAALLPDLEGVLAPFGARPHWGKMSSLDAGAIDALYPRLGDFRDLVARWDPTRTFASRFGERVLGT